MTTLDVSCGRPTHVEIDLGALRHNLQQARHAAPSARIMAAVKADGYGHGLIRTARALRSADALGVACIDEALEVRASGILADITLLEGFFRAEELELVRCHRLDTVIHHPHQLSLLEAASPGEPVKVWIKVDTGMHRLGFPPEAVQDVFRRLDAIQYVRILGVMTHLANADDRRDQVTRRQLKVFAAATTGLSCARSIANSAGLLGWPETHSEWARPGIMLYGVSPFIGGRGEQEGLRPAMTLRTELIAVNHFKKGEPLGYGGTWLCPEDMPVGVAAVGYGDGYPRHAPSGTPVLLNGRRVPLAGRVSMDMITLDLRTQPEARVGDPVVLWGEGLPVEEVAEHAGTIPYELLCGITARVKRVEVGQSAALDELPVQHYDAG